MTLLSAAQLAEIQALGRSGMTATVVIYPQSYDSGLDLTDDPYGSTLTHSTTASSTVAGWLVGRWANRRDIQAGDIDTTTPYRLRLPVGTVIEAGDNVEIDGNRYHVVDVGEDQTWPEWLNCSVVRSK